MNKETVNPKGRRQLVTLFIIAFVSLGGSYLAFYVASSGGGWGTTNNGEFVEPQTSAHAVGLHLPQEERTWWLLVLADDCAAECQQMVKDLRALHILLNREADRAQRGITLTNPATDQGWLDAFPDLHRLEWVPSAVFNNGVYIIDPNGNFVFRYGLEVNPKLILEDFKKLLKVSQIG